MSALWFPVEERTKATAIVVAMYGVGLALSFIIGPNMVPQPSNVTVGPSMDLQPPHMAVLYSFPEDFKIPLSETEEIRSDIRDMLYLAFGWSVFLFILVVVYFPSKPPTPPSRTAAIQRTDYVTGIKQIAQNLNFWILALCYALPSGIGLGWASVLEITLGEIGVSQETSGWLGFAFILTGNLSGIVAGICADIFKRRLKLFVFLLYALAAASIGCFILIYKGLIHSIPLLYISLILGAIGIVSPTPIFFELACDTTYPVSEGITNGIFTTINNIPAVLFLIVLTLPGMSTSWVNWCMLGAVLSTFPLLYFYKEQHTRLDIDLPRV